MLNKFVFFLSAHNAIIYNIYVLCTEHHCMQVIHALDQSKKGSRLVRETVQILDQPGKGDGPRSARERISKGLFTPRMITINIMIKI